MLLSAQTAPIYTSTMCVCACHYSLALRPQIPTRGTGSGSRLVSISVYVFIYQFIDKHVEWECSSVVHFKTHTRALVLSSCCVNYFRFLWCCFFCRPKQALLQLGPIVSAKSTTSTLLLLLLFFPSFICFPSTKSSQEQVYLFPRCYV